MKNFIQDETGAFTVDWVVLAAGLIALSFAVMSVVSGGTEEISHELGQSLTEHNAEFTHF